MKANLCSRWMIAALVSVLVSTAAVAEPPPGHPSPAQARDMLLPEKAPRPAELPNQGKVVSFLHANEFTYVEVARQPGSATEWIAVEKQEFKVGSMIRFDDGAVMQNFYSKLLKRTFPSVMFVDYVAPAP
jgi:hypothetical protein